MNYIFKTTATMKEYNNKKGYKTWYTQGKSTAAQAAILYPLIRCKRLYGVLHGRKGL